jgi:UDP-2-acetamido-2-deoxy-ribo-hexuluronate aminotransferase
LAHKHQLFVVEDNAQAIGAHYTFADGTQAQTGTIGQIGCTSFFPSKNLGCYGDGGALYTQDAQLAEKIRMIANHGQKVKYVHEVVGCNSRLDALQAAILRVKLQKLNSYIAARQAVAAAYDSAFQHISGLSIPARSSYTTHVFHQYTLKVHNGQREGLQQHLQALGVPTMIYYPIPAHKQHMFAQFGVSNLSLPISEALCTEVLSLPIHTEMLPEQQQYIIESVLSFFK